MPLNSPDAVMKGKYHCPSVNGISCGIQCIVVNGASNYGGLYAETDGSTSPSVASFIMSLRGRFKAGNLSNAILQILPFVLQVKRLRLSGSHKPEFLLLTQMLAGLISNKLQRYRHGLHNILWIPCIMEWGWMLLSKRMSPESKLDKTWESNGVSCSRSHYPEVFAPPPELSHPASAK